MKFIKAKTESELNFIRELFSEYFSRYGKHLGNQDFEKELSGLPGKYASPKGCLLLALDGDLPAGCIGIKPFEEHSCEMGRLYVKDKFRNRGIGLKLVKIFLEETRKMGYKKILLDTLPELKSAIKLYKSLGFSEIPPYYDSPLPNPVYMSLDIQGLEIFSAINPAGKDSFS